LQDIIDLKVKEFDYSIKAINNKMMKDIVNASLILAINEHF
jgi:hypothetical protein